MGALPKKKTSKSRSKIRFASKKYQPANLTACPDCGRLRISHRVCQSCGSYKGRIVFKPEEKTKVTKVKEE